MNTTSNQKNNLPVPNKSYKGLLREIIVQDGQILHDHSKGQLLIAPGISQNQKSNTDCISPPASASLPLHLLYFTCAAYTQPFLSSSVLQTVKMCNHAFTEQRSFSEVTRSTNTQKILGPSITEVNSYTDSVQPPRPSTHTDNALENY